MGISLVSAPILGFDLARHPAGGEIADLLLTGLSLGPQDLQLYTPDPARIFRRQGAWHSVEKIIDARGAGSLPGSVLAPTSESLSGFTAIADSLLRSMITDLDDIEKLIRDDVLLWTTSGNGPRATLRAVPRGDDLPDTELVKCAGDALIDATAALWIDGLDSQTASVLSEPQQLVQTLLPDRLPDIGPCEQSLTEFLHTLRCLDDEGRTRLRAAAEQTRAVGQQWAGAVHEASWAALTTGRIRAAAAAQLSGVKAFHTAGFTAADGAEGLWNTISGHIQAEAVADVLSAETHTLLTRTWESAFNSERNGTAK